MRPNHRIVPFLLVAVLLVGALLTAVGAIAAEERAVTLWHYTRGESMNLLAAAFEEEHPHIKVTPEHMGDFRGEKFFLHLAAGTGPDVVWADGTLATSWAASGAIQPLTQWVERKGLKRSHFVEPSWDQAVWGGHIWALPLYLDANFSMVYNKEMLNNAGVQPPTTITQLDVMAPKLTKFASDGTLTQTTTVPWDVHGAGNSIYTWGWAFGGSFWDPVREKITANDPQVVRALEWMGDPARRYGFEAVNQLLANLPSGQDSFIAQRVAFRCAHQGMSRNIATNFADLEFGLSPLPYHLAYVNEPQTWIGGFTLVMSSGAKDPDAAWEFIYYATADPKGTRKYGEISGAFSGLKSALTSPHLTRDPIAAHFLEILQGARHTRPPVPNQGKYYNELNAGVYKAVRQEVTAKQILDEITVSIQKDLDDIMAKQRQK